MHSFVKDPSLAAQGKRNLAFAETTMGALMQIRKEFTRRKTLRGLRIGMALHVTKETGILVRTLRDAGADVAITGCNPLSTQDDVAAALADEGVKVWAYKGESKEDYYRFLEAVIETRPQITIDDGCDLVTLLHTKHKPLLRHLIGGCEETTTGVIRLRAMERDKKLRIPMIAVNDNQTKHLMDNYYGTGQSVIDGVTRATNLLWAGKMVVVVGYGDCGKGVAKRAQGLGSIVSVAEVNPVRALQARMDGYYVAPLMELASRGDVFITVTGDKHVLAAKHFDRMKHGAMLANGGHFDIEIDLPALRRQSREIVQVRPSLQEYKLGGNRTAAKKSLFVLAEGRLVNLAAAEGHPSEVMALSFSGQALAVEYLVKHRKKLKPGVYTLPGELDERIAHLQLKSLGISIDTLTAEQKRYLHSWKEGT